MWWVRMQTWRPLSAGHNIIFGRWSRSSHKWFTCQASDRCLPNKKPCFCNRSPWPANRSAPWQDFPSRLPADSTLRLVQSRKAGVSGMPPRSFPDGWKGLNRSRAEPSFRLSGSNGDGSGLFCESLRPTNSASDRSRRALLISSMS